MNRRATHCLSKQTGCAELILVSSSHATPPAGYAEAMKVENLQPHNNAVAPPCQHFGTCGGCTLQSMTYEAQLSEKQNQVHGY